MSCSECDRFRSALIDANLQYVDATSRLMAIANREVREGDAAEYASITAELDDSRRRMETIQREFAVHKINTHGEQTWAAGR